MIPLRNRYPVNFHRVFPRQKLWFTKTTKKIPWGKPHVYVYKAIIINEEAYYFIEWWELLYSIRKRK